MDREEYLDTLEIWVEVSEDLFSDETRRLQAFEEQVRSRIEQAVGLEVRVRLVEPRTLERSEEGGKALRVIDRRQAVPGSE